MPSKPGCQYSESGIEGLGATLAIRWRYPHLRHGPPVTIPLVAIKADFFTENQGAHSLLGSLSEGLSLFGSVDSGKADLVLGLISVKHRDGITVCNAHDNTGNIGENRQRN